MIPLIPIAAGVVIGGSILYLVRSVMTIATDANPVTVPSDKPKGTTIRNSLVPFKNTDVPDLVPVKLGDDTWMVASDYIGPIGINEAANLAKSMGFELPSPALVDAIWRQADLKLLPQPRDNVISQAVFDDQKRRIQDQIAGRPFTLLGGAFKDVVQVNGHPEIYGWHVEDGKTVAGVPLLKPVTPGPGKVIQPQSGKRHDSPGPIGFKDYSQGLRLVRKA